MPPYSHHELQQTLDFYAHLGHIQNHNPNPNQVGHIQNRELAAQLCSDKPMHDLKNITQRSFS